MNHIRVSYSDYTWLTRYPGGGYKRIMTEGTPTPPIYEPNHAVDLYLINNDWAYGRVRASNLDILCVGESVYATGPSSPWSIKYQYI